jgi:hypothetical protein
MEDNGSVSSSSSQGAACTHNKSLHDSELAGCRPGKAVWNRLQEQSEISKVAFIFEVAELHHPELVIDSFGALAKAKLGLLSRGKGRECLLFFVYEDAFIVGNSRHSFSLFEKIVER